MIIIIYEVTVKNGFRTLKTIHSKMRFFNAPLYIVTLYTIINLFLHFKYFHEIFEKKKCFLKITCFSVQFCKLLYLSMYLYMYVYISNIVVVLNSF